MLRFPKYHGEWVSVKLKELVNRVNHKNRNNQTQLALTIAAQYGLVDQTTFFNRQIASIDMSNYYLLYKGEFAYNRSYSRDYPWGAVKRLELYEKGALSTLYICFKSQNSINSDYLLHYFESTKWHQGISEIAGEGARNHGLLNISLEDYFATHHYVPHSEEQKEVALFLNLCSERVGMEQKTLSCLEKQRRYLLQNLFI